MDRSRNNRDVRRSAAGGSGYYQGHTSSPSSHNTNTSSQDFQLPSNQALQNISSRGQHHGVGGPNTRQPPQFAFSGFNNPQYLNQAHGQQAVGEQQAPRYVPPHARRPSVAQPTSSPVAIKIEDSQGQPSPTPTGMSNNYRGSRTRTENISEDISDDENTSVWIQGLPPNCSYDMLLANLEKTGKVFATVVNKPIGLHNTSASKVVFWDRSGVNNLLRKSAKGEFVFPGNFSPTVELNRIKTSAQPVSNRSRVIFVTGPEQFVNFDNLYRFFSEGIVFQLEQVSQIRTEQGSGVVTLRWAFGSYRLQAQSAFKKLHDAIAASRLRGGNPDLAAVHVAWGPDPCEPQN